MIQYGTSGGDRTMKRKQTAAAAAAVLLALSSPLSVPAGPSGADGGAGEAYLAELNDGVLQYSELPGLVERYNVTYKNTYAQIAGQSQSREAARQLGKDADEAMEEALDLKEDDMDEATRALYESYKEAAKAMRKQAAKLSDEDLSGTAERSLKMLKNQQTMLAQNLMIQYQKTSSKKELLAKQEELAKAGYDAAAARAGLGMASSEEVLSANQSWLQAQSAAVQIDSAVNSLKQNLLITCGWNADSDPEIAQLPEADFARLDSMNLAADTETAVQANYGLISLRQNGGKGSVGRGILKRNVSQSRQSIAVSVESLYAKTMAARQAYEGAEANFQAAVLDMQAADQKNAMGMMSRIDYLKAQAAYLTAKSERDDAKADLFSSMQNYDWALKGMTVS